MRVPAFLPDTTCMVAAVCGWHEHHERAAAEIERRLSHGETMIVAAPALVETYAVLTRLPPPHRVLPGSAYELVRANFIEGIAIAGLAAEAYGEVLTDAVGRGVAGGRTYDAVIVACALAGGASSLLTFNERDFVSVAGKRLEIVVP